MSGEGGWVQLHRRLAEHPLWVRDRFTRGQAWVDLILRAAWKGYTAFQGNRSVPVSRGQVLTSQVRLAERWKWNRKTVRGFLEALRAARMVDIETSKDTDTGYTLVTLLNYELFQGLDQQPMAIAPDNTLDIPLPFERTSSGHRVPTENKVEEGKEAPSPASGLTLPDYLTRFSPEGQELLRQTVEAIATTRRTGKVAGSVLDGLARKLSRYQEAAVLAACRIYLARGYAAEGRAEAYLLGIVRGEAKRGNGGREMGGPRPQAAPGGSFKTEGQRLIEQALARQQAEQGTRAPVAAPVPSEEPEAPEASRGPEGVPVAEESVQQAEPAKQAEPAQRPLRPWRPRQ